jgi:hypothetical protein
MLAKALRSMVKEGLFESPVGNIMSKKRVLTVPVAIVMTLILRGANQMLIISPITLNAALLALYIPVQGTLMLE